MSFDFNVLSSSDEEEEKYNHRLLGGNNNTIAFANPATAFVSKDATIAESAYGDNDDNESYFEFQEEYERKGSSLVLATAAKAPSVSLAFSDFGKELLVSDSEKKRIINSDDDDDIDWEDASDAMEHSENNDAATTATISPLPIPKTVTTCLNYSNNAQSTTTIKRGKRKRNNDASTIRSVRIFRHDRLDGNPQLQNLLGQLHKVSLLTWVSHVWYGSRCASKHQELAHSLLPHAWLPNLSSLYSSSNNDGYNSNGYNSNGYNSNGYNIIQSTMSSTTPPPKTVIPNPKMVGHFVQWFVDYTAHHNTINNATDAANPSTKNTGNLKTRRRRTGKLTRLSTSPPIRTTSTRTRKRRKKQPPYSPSKRASTNNANAPIDSKLVEYCAQLSDCHRQRYPQQQDGSAFHRENKNDNDCVRVLLFVSMARSMGWRVRYSVSLEPISRDLDIHHPLFNNDGGRESAMAKFFRTIATTTTETATKTSSFPDENKKTDFKLATVKATNQSKSVFNKKYPASLYSSSNSNCHICWAEVLCSSTATSRTKSNKQKQEQQEQQLKWMHVDPIRGTYNRPSVVEELLLLERQRRLRHSKDGRSNRRNTKTVPISYALAAEHLDASSSLSSRDKQTNTISAINATSNSTTISTTANKTAVDKDNKDSLLVVKLTDVTRRYASSMVDTMAARGIVIGRPISKPNRRKEYRNQRMGFMLPLAAKQQQENDKRPDLWLARILSILSTSIRTKTKKPKMHFSKRTDIVTIPPQSSSTVRETRNAHKEGGRFKDDAIALDADDGQDLDKKGAAVDPKINHIDDTKDIDREEESQLRESAQKEPLPTSKAAFKKHPMYVIRSVLNSTEVLKPNANKYICGMFKGELVYRRQDVETALSAKRWLYEGRRVQDSELKNPILRVKARKPPAPKGGNGFKALATYGVGAHNDGSEEFRVKQIKTAEADPSDRKECLYGSWQTDLWEPPTIGPGDPLPVNEHKNIELELLNPGLVHVELYQVSKVAKKLGLPYAPCMLGFERAGKPTVRGIVVHETNEELLREAQAGMADHLLKEENKKREQTTLLRWKRLLVGVLTKDRLEREYGHQDETLSKKLR